VGDGRFGLAGGGLLTWQLLLGPPLTACTHALTTALPSTARPTEPQHQQPHATPTTPTTPETPTTPRNPDNPNNNPNKQSDGRHTHFAPGHDVPLEEEEDEELIHEMEGDLAAPVDLATEDQDLASVDGDGLSSQAAESGDAAAAATEDEAATAAAQPPSPKRLRAGGNGGSAMEVDGAVGESEGEEGVRRSGRQRASGKSGGGGGTEGPEGGAGASDDRVRRSGRAAKPRVVYMDGVSRVCGVFWVGSWHVRGAWTFCGVGGWVFRIQSVKG